MPALTSPSFPNGPIIVWFRNDLRIRDNAALLAAVKSSNDVICVYILDQYPDGTTTYGEAQLWWLHHSLKALMQSIKNIGGKLILQKGLPEKIIPFLVEKTGTRTVLWNRRYAPSHIKRDAAIKSNLIQNGVNVTSYDGALLHEPTQLRTGSDSPYRVYTPFWRTFSARQEPRNPAPAPKIINAYQEPIDSDELSNWKLLPNNPDWTQEIACEWKPGEKKAHDYLSSFLNGPANHYKNGRDFPAQNNTSKLSPYLAFGEITPFQIWAELSKKQIVNAPDQETFRKEIVWREFSYHLLVNFDDLKHKNFNKDFDHFPWRQDDQQFKAWQRGLTGYPIVDAGMRQLWQTGWMHNRVRMIVASFLVKHLMIDWREGEKWFWNTLVDADPASNTASWQWVAGSGADAAPYFRIFNPIIQGEKFDKEGRYVKTYCPELRDLPIKYVHKPWEASQAVLKKANIVLGSNYPKPIIDHKIARERALDAYKSMKEINK